jgi:hypothetical protein
MFKKGSLLQATTPVASVLMSGVPVGLQPHPKVIFAAAILPAHQIEGSAGMANESFFLCLLIRQFPVKH